MKLILQRLLFKFWLWTGTKLFNYVVLYVPCKHNKKEHVDNCTVEGFVFSNNKNYVSKVLDLWKED